MSTLDAQVILGWVLLDISVGAILFVVAYPLGVETTRAWLGIRRRLNVISRQVHNRRVAILDRELELERLKNGECTHPNCPSRRSVAVGPVVGEAAMPASLPQDDGAPGQPSTSVER